MAGNSRHRDVCIVGGGPAGMLLGYLAARAGLNVCVLEKHGDFLRDFRGDTIHPSTYEIFAEVGLLDSLLAITDFRMDAVKVSVEGKILDGPALKHLKDVRCRFIGFAPQWNVLGLLAEAAQKFPNFELRMNATVDSLVHDESGRVSGVGGLEAGGRFQMHSSLVVGADGRDSALRAAANLEVVAHSVPIDVLWFAVDRPGLPAVETLLWLRKGQMLVTIPRRSYYQVAMVIPKGSFEEIKAEGLAAFFDRVATVCPMLAAARKRISSMDDIKLLTVQMNYLKKWHAPGLLFIGDAAHAMSPVGGVGVNLAFQDAVATANLLASERQDGVISDDLLAAIQARREPPARRTQRFQGMVHSVLFKNRIGKNRKFVLPRGTPLLLRALAPLLRRIAGRVVGVGFRPEHVTADIAEAKTP